MIEITSVVVMIFTAFMVGYVLGVEHGADEERCSQDRDSRE